MNKPIYEQAKERGVPIPYGAFAAELTNDGWDVSPDIPPEALLVANDSIYATLNNDPTNGSSWRVMPTHQVAQLALIADDVLKDQAFKDRAHILDETRDRCASDLKFAAERAEAMGLPTRARYYRVMAEFAKTLTWKTDFTE